MKFQSDINSTASQLSRKLDAYAAALKKYQQFLDEAHSTYRELDQLEFDGFGNLSKSSAKRKMWSGDPPQRAGSISLKCSRPMKEVKTADGEEVVLDAKNLC